MHKILLLLLLGAQPDYTREVLVTTTAATITRLEGSRGVEIQNLGPNAIYCSLGSTAVLNKSRKIAAGGFWSVSVPRQVDVSCIAETANQLTGAATIVTEVVQ